MGLKVSESMVRIVRSGRTRASPRFLGDPWWAVFNSFPKMAVVRECDCENVRGRRHPRSDARPSGVAIAAFALVQNYDHVRFHHLCHKRVKARLVFPAKLGSRLTRIANK